MSRRGRLLFLAMCVVWGIPYLLIRVAVRQLSPPVLVFFRTAPAALLLLPLAQHRRYLRPLLTRWRVVLVYTAVEIAGPWLLLSRAEQRLSSSVTGLLIAAVPLIGASLAVLVAHGDTLDRRRTIGLMVGFAGVAALVGFDVGGTSPIAVAEVALTAVGYAIGPMIISRRFADIPGLGVVAASFGLTALAYAPFALTDLPPRVSGQVVASVAALTVACTALAFVLFFALVVEVGPARATVITYVNPAVAVILGVGLLGERFTTRMAISFPLILAGSVLATRGPRSPAAPRPGQVGIRRARPGR